MLNARFVAATAALFLGTGCVPLTDYRKLEDRYKEQELYVKRNKDLVKELEKQNQFITLSMKEKENDMKLLRDRLAKSEKLRQQLETDRSKPAPVVVTEQPASMKPQTDTTTFSGFHVNGETGGIVLEHDLLFASGSAVLKDGGKKVIDELCHKLNGTEYKKYFIRVDGHTDSQPVVRTKKENHDNFELGAKRAKVVLDYMMTKGVSQERLFLASFGENAPLVKEKGESTKITKSHGKDKKTHVTTHSEKGSAENRRVEIVLFEKMK